MFPNLELMDVGNNYLQGSIPERLGAGNLTLITGTGNSAEAPVLKIAQGCGSLFEGSFHILFVFESTCL